MLDTLYAFIGAGLVVAVIGLPLFYLAQRGRRYFPTEASRGPYLTFNPLWWKTLLFYTFNAMVIFLIEGYFW